MVWHAEIKSLKVKYNTSVTTPQKIYMSYEILILLYWGVNAATITITTASRNKCHCVCIAIMKPIMLNLIATRILHTVGIAHTAGLLSFNVSCK